VNAKRALNLEVELHSFLASTLYGGEWSALLPGSFNPEAIWAPETVWRPYNRRKCFVPARALAIALSFCL
jgi:hypothetical protein